ncbi:hypothetical protein LOTGIDRAFT_238027 [Lottia gigantea]|uniref:Codanin-1 C-terminal domain-containing protein n=1 Tax=Lottia gigantea TaxID=225164 RepID=V4AE51_LOTGI|nr:hypothetical protein LOTGIDRAFT_238027 [Lottia gigantea]ESP02299.1 hypothetical protein LOTGIDRAFT_238027 [Lottia gigantea]
MASILELALDEKVCIKDIIIWLLSKSKDESLPDVFKEHKTVRQEFIPFFLNYLRDQTLHLLQNSKLNGSPSKTPLSSQCSDTNKQLNKKVNPNSSSKRMQLFEDSPSDNNKEFCSPIYSPGNESPVFRNSSERQKKYDQKFFQRGHKSPNMTPEPKSGKYKLSLGEFMSPDPGQRRKSSPFSSTNKDLRENSPSPTVMISDRGNKSSGKKRATLHTISKNTSSFKEKSPVFNLSENDFPPVGATNNNRDETPKPKRRINPTQLLPDAKKNAAAKFKKLAEVVEKPGNANINGVKSDTAMSSVDGDICLADERELLRHLGSECLFGFMSDRKEKAKRLSMESMSTTSTVSTPSKFSLDRRTSCSSNTEYITACLHLVTHSDKLNILVQLYSSCLDEHLFPNISVELYFLIQLLTSLSEDIKPDTPSVNIDSEDMSLFVTVHNAVYFSVNVLQKQLNLLKYLDRSVIKLLAENKRLVDFSSELHSNLLELYTSSFSVKKYPTCPRSPIGGVSFQADTDNRKNFPSDKLFHQFKKQRDMFYELIREWEEKRLTTGWSVQEVLGNKIRFLVNVNTDLVNHLHFARLFLSQLISMCKGDGVIRTEDDDNIALLAHLKKTNPAKFKKLQERFIQPFSVGGPCPPVSFPGNQEFFKEFIVAASSPVLNQHLSNIFTGKIKKLNSTEFSQNPSEENQESEGINQVFLLSKKAVYFLLITHKIKHYIIKRYCSSEHP